MMAGHLTLFAFCLALIALASAAQTAFSYLNAARIRRLMQQGVPRAEALAQVANTPAALLSSVGFVHLIAVVGATATVFDWVRREELLFGGLLAIVAAGLVLFVQTFARGLAAARAERMAVALYMPLRALGPFTQLLTWPWRVLSDLILRALFRVRPEDRVATSEEDLRILVDAVEETEALEEEEREMITSIFEMSDRDVSQIMVPRIDVIAAEAATSVSEAADLLLSSGHSRLPVYEGDLDQILGVVHLRALTMALREGRGDATVAELARPMHAVPETKKIDELLHEFQEQHLQMALVADEYGGTAGIVTIEDLLEEIVGEIRDEYDVEEERVQVVSDTEAIMDARVSIHDANEVVPLGVGDDKYDTIGGLVYDRLGKVPAAGDVVELDRCTIRVLSTRGRRVHRVQITMAEHGRPEANGAG